MLSKSVQFCHTCFIKEEMSGVLDVENIRVKETCLVVLDLELIFVKRKKRSLR